MPEHRGDRDGWVRAKFVCRVQLLIVAIAGNLPLAFGFLHLPYRRDVLVAPRAARSAVQLLWCGRKSLEGRLRSDPERRILGVSGTQAVSRLRRHRSRAEAKAKN